MPGRKPIRTFRDLFVWQKSFELCGNVYRITRDFPLDERFGISAELRKTARSIAYNIAEGHGRSSTREYIRFLDIATGSASELETQLLLSRSLGYVDPKASEHLLRTLAEVDRMLAALMRRLRQKAES